MTSNKNWVLIILSCFGVGLVVALSVKGKLFGRQRNGTKSPAVQSYEDSLICHIELTLMSLSDGIDEETFNCVVISTSPADSPVKADKSKVHGLTVALDLPSTFVYEHRKAIDTGALFVQIPGAYINEQTIERFGVVATSVAVPENATISALTPEEIKSMVVGHQTRRQRREQELEKDVAGTGVRSVMVIRVTTDDASPSVGATEIEERMYSDTQFSFASQYRDCSFGELIFQPADANTPVIELYVPGLVSSFTERTILNAATKAATDIYGDDIFDRVDHAVFCMPPGTSGKPYIAYSGVGSYFSVYHDTRCAYPTTVMHEIAHNIGLGHAFEGGEEYGDETTIMGFSSSDRDGPKKCFNGQNIFHFGWFQDRAVMLDPFQGGHLLELSPFVDYEKTFNHQSVIITVFDMHIVYNRAKGFNSGTSEYQNKVTITKEENEINSSLLAVMDMDNPVFIIPNILGTGRTFMVELCESVIGDAKADYYTLSIGLDSSNCPPKFVLPTPGPTRQTPMPTSFPTPRLTPSPSERLSTPGPTPSETVATLAPSFIPTPSPTTGLPSIHPTRQPGIVYVPPEQVPTTDISDVWIITQDEEDTFEKPAGPGLGVIPTPSPLVGTTFSGPNVAVGLQEENTDAIEREPQLSAIMFVAITLAIIVSCCAVGVFRWNQRRIDEQKRKIRIRQYNASAVKIYISDPV